MRWLLSLFFILLIGFVCSSSVSNTSLDVDSLNYSVYVNGTINIDRLFIDATSIRLYNLSKGGLFYSNSTYDTIISFYNITSPINDLRWDNETIIYNLTTINITVPPNRYFNIEDNETITGNTTIYLLRPSDYTEDTDGIVDFFYNTTSPNNIINCSLYLDNTLYAYDDTITKNIEQFFIVISMYESNNVRWYINCIDNIGNKVNSSVYHLDTMLGGSGYNGEGGNYIPYIPPNLTTLLDDNTTIRLVNGTIIVEKPSGEGSILYFVIILMFGLFIFIFIYVKKKYYRDLVKMWRRWKDTKGL